MSTWRTEKWGALALLGLLVATALVHVHGMRHFGRDTEPHGDEVLYLDRARVVARWDEHSLVPGRLDFADRGGRRSSLDTLRHRPPLALNVFAHLVPFRERAGERVAGPTQVLFQRIRWLHLGLLLVTLGCLYAQSRLLGLGPLGSLVAPGLLAVSPWYGFYVHSAFAEPLRTSLLNVSFTFLIAHLRTRSVVWLVPAGVAAGYAVFARSSFLQFVAVAALLVAATDAFVGAAARPLRRGLRGAVAALVFAASVMAVVGPQLRVNAGDGIEQGLATNTWRNLERGLCSPRFSSPERRTWGKASKAEYLASAKRYREREALSRERTLECLREIPVATLVGNQLEKFFFVLFRFQNKLEYAVRTERWGERSPDLAWLLPVSRVHWVVVLLLGLVGMAWVGWRSPGWLLLSLFALYYFAALAVVPVVARFMIPLLPTLCVLAAGALGAAASRWAGRRPPPVSWTPRVPKDPGVAPVGPDPHSTSRT